MSQESLHVAIYFYQLDYGATDKSTSSTGHGSHDHKTTYFESKIGIPRDSERDVSIALFKLAYTLNWYLGCT